MRHHVPLWRRVLAAAISFSLSSALLAFAQDTGRSPRAGVAAPPNSPSNQSDDAQSDEKSATPPRSTGGAQSSKPKNELDDDLDAKLKAKKKKEERKDDFELHGVRTSPFDIAVPYFKSNHWTLFHLELLANNRDEEVEIRSGCEALYCGGAARAEGGTPHEVRCRRQIHLVKADERRYRLPMFVPDAHRSKNVNLAIYRPGSVMEISPPGLTQQGCIRIEADQFLIPVLSPDAEKYNFLSRLQCVTPGNDEDDDPPPRRRYYWLVMPEKLKSVNLPDTMLGWTTTSHLIWDKLDPTVLTAGQRDALIDWLHFGGQLIVSGGQSATNLSQSFLAPYLPADVDAVDSGELIDLSALSSKYPIATNSRRAQLQVIRILPTKPVYVAKLKPRPEATPVEDAASEFPLVVERTIGRGRIVMTAFSLYQPELVNWGGYDTFWRKRLLGVITDEKPVESTARISGGASYVRRGTRELSRFRITARDLGGGSRRRDTAATATPTPTGASTGTKQFNFVTTGSDEPSGQVETVADWRDDGAVVNQARQTLINASGIEIPAPEFVLWAASAYLLVLVPLNWLVCRFGLRRPELAWLAAPVIVLGFAVGIVMLAKRNVGFDMVSREIDVVEAFAGHPRAHLSRFTCVYSGSRRRCEFRYESGAAVAMPMSTGGMQRGQNIERLQLDWDLSSHAAVTLGRYEIHPRSIGMIRAEEMIPLVASAGANAKQADGFVLETDDSGHTILRNNTPWTLWDCQVVMPEGVAVVGDLGPDEFAALRWQSVTKHDTSKSERPRRMLRFNDPTLPPDVQNQLAQALAERDELIGQERSMRGLIDALVVQLNREVENDGIVDSDARTDFQNQIDLVDSRRKKLVERINSKQADLTAIVLQYDGTAEQDSSPDAAVSLPLLLHLPSTELGDLSPESLLKVLTTESLGTPAVLIGWMPQRLPGQEIDPAPDRKLAFAVVVVHLGFGTESIGEPNNPKSASELPRKKPISELDSIDEQIKRTREERERIIRESDALVRELKELTRRVRNDLRAGAVEGAIDLEPSAPKGE